jgi:F-type H+-transporting ATPase subunit delta
VTNQILAKRYAKALLTLGREDGNYGQYAEELNTFAAFWERHPEFVDAVSNPLYGKDNRKVICQAVAAKLGLSLVFRSLLDLMIERNRLRIVPDVRSYYQKLLDEMANLSRAEVTSATILSGEEVAAIKAALEKVTGGTVMVETQVDPGLIGGVVARVGDLVLDGSVRTQLASIKETLVKG